MAISDSSVVPVCVVAFVDADDYLVRFWLTLIPPGSDFAGTFLKRTRKLFLVRIRTFHNRQWRSDPGKWTCSVVQKGEPLSDARESDLAPIGSEYEFLEQWSGENACLLVLQLKNFHESYSARAVRAAEMDGVPARI